MKKRLISLLLALSVAVSLLCTAAFAAESTGVGITPVTNPDLWTTRLNSQGQSYSYRPPTAAGRQLWCMDLGYSYRYGTESFLQSYTYRSATGADADALWNDAVAETGLGEMDAITQENVKWMMSYIADYTGEIPGSLFMALQTYIWTIRAIRVRAAIPAATSTPEASPTRTPTTSMLSITTGCWARKLTRTRNCKPRWRNTPPRASMPPSWRMRAPSGRCWPPPACPGGRRFLPIILTAKS